jgi:cell cycle sensor histidine kinase DivJ
MPAGDGISAHRQRVFIANQFLAGLLALAAFPLWLAFAGPISPAEAMTFVWLAAPLLVAVFQWKTGRTEVAHLLSATAFTTLLVWVSALTGGLGSPVLIWLAVIPIEAALSGSRRISASAAAIGLVGLALLWAGLHTGFLPATTPPPTPVGLGIMVAAIVYAGALSLALETLRRDTEDTARLGEARYRLLADHATDMITCHAADGSVLFASPAARGLVGLPTAQLLGEGLFARVHIADRPAYLSALNRAVTGNTTASVDFRVLRNVDGADGDHFTWVEMRCHPSPGVLGASAALVATTRDVSDRKAQEFDLREAREQAEAANQAKSRFLATMSHELRTPLNAIIGFSQLLEREDRTPGADERRRDYARVINQSGEHLLEVLNSILDMSKIEAGRISLAPESFDIAPLMTSCVEIMSHQATERGIGLRAELPDYLPLLTADRAACRQIIINLVSNALKFTGPGGQVVAGVSVDGDNLVIFVRDNGVGIAADVLPRLGTPFVQGYSAYDRRHEGSGLGLSVVKGLAALHGGALTLESELGKGTIARVALPLHGCEDETVRGSSEIAIEPMPQPQRKRA